MSDFYPEDTILRPMTYQDAILILQNKNPERGDIWIQMENELRKWIRENEAEMFETLAEHRKEILTAAFPDDFAVSGNDPAFTSTQLEKLAGDILKFLRKNGLWHDVRIYFDGKCWATDNGCGEGEPLYDPGEKESPVFLLRDKSPTGYFEYVASPHILSMSFEGQLYECLNGYAGDYGWQIEEEFSQLLRKYGCFYELGNAWNLTLYKL